MNTHSITDNEVSHVTLRPDALGCPEECNHNGPECALSCYDDNEEFAGTHMSQVEDSIPQRKKTNTIPAPQLIEPDTGAHSTTVSYSKTEGWILILRTPCAGAYGDIVVGSTEMLAYTDELLAHWIARAELHKVYVFECVRVAGG